MWLGLNHLQEHKFKRSFQDSLNPLCNCGLDIKLTAHFLFHCLKYITERRTLLSTTENIDNNLLDPSQTIFIKTLLFGSNSFDTNANTNIFNATIAYVLLTKRFEKPLFQWSPEIFKQGYESANFESIVIITRFIILFYLQIFIIFFS